MGDDWRKLPNALVDAVWCGPIELAVYAAVRRLTPYTTDTVTVGTDKIAKLAGCGRTAVKAALRTLAEHQWITAEHRTGSTSTYRVHTSGVRPIIERPATLDEITDTAPVRATADQRAKVRAMVADLGQKLSTTDTDRVATRPGRHTTGSPHDPTGSPHDPTGSPHDHPSLPKKRERRSGRYRGRC